MKQIIILDVTSAGTGQISVRAVFWLPVPDGAQVARPSASSSWVGATPEEIEVLRAGKVTEEVLSINMPPSFDEQQVRERLEETYHARAAFFSALPFKGSLFGTSFDGTSWTKR